MSLLDFRKPKCVVVDKCVSYSGKYKGFFGHHYVKGKLCYDVGTTNVHTGEIVTRHYNEHSFPNPKMEAMKVWHELKKGLVKKPISEETDDNKVFKPWERPN